MSKVIYDFSGERYVVSGASSGIGRQIALDLAGAGALVLGLGRNAGRLAELKGECPERIVTSSLDVCDSVRLEESVREFVKTYGKLNGSVHAAGIDILTPVRSLVDGGGGHSIMSTNFWAGAELLRIATSESYAQARTSNVLISSVSSLTADKAKTVYASSKAAVDSLVRSASRELEGHRVNSILPGCVDTPLTRGIGESANLDDVVAGHLLGMGSTGQVSQAVMFLLSDDSIGMNGCNFVVDGGYSS